MAYVLAMAALNVQAHWDPEAHVWWADSEDIPGLVTEADTFSEIVQHVRSLAPLMIRENLGPPDRTGDVVRVTDGKDEESFQV
jgi:predicted RNase H-like HicB family nuclease